MYFDGITFVMPNVTSHPLLSHCGPLSLSFSLSLSSLFAFPSSNSGFCSSQPEMANSLTHTCTTCSSLSMMLLTAFYYFFPFFSPPLYRFIYFLLSLLLSVSSLSPVLLASPSWSIVQCEMNEWLEMTRISAWVMLFHWRKWNKHSIQGTGIQYTLMDQRFFTRII